MDAGNLDVFDRLCAPNYRYYAAGASEPLTCAEHKASAAAFYAAFRGFGHTLDDVLVSGNKVAFRLTDFGTHTGEFFGISATGNNVRFRVIGTPGLRRVK